MPFDTEDRREKHPAAHSYLQRSPLVISPKLADNFIRPLPIPDASDEFGKAIGMTVTLPIQLSLEIIKQHPFKRRSLNGRIFLRFLSHRRRQIYDYAHAISSNAAYYTKNPPSKGGGCAAGKMTSSGFKALGAGGQKSICRRSRSLKQRLKSDVRLICLTNGTPQKVPRHC